MQSKRKRREENIWFRKISFFVEEKKNREGVEENVWRRKINFLRRSFWNTGFGNTGNQSQDGEMKLPV